MIEEFDPNDEALLIVTPAATKHFMKCISNHENALGVELTVKKTGCSGLTYVTQVVSHTPQNHELIEIDGIRYYMDEKARPFLKGLVLDFLKKDLGLSQLVYHNPNESARCGCGESFTITELEE
jgi:iron-sulfur cluster assembly protein